MDQNEILEAAKKYIAEEKDADFRKEVEDLVAKKDMKELEDRFYTTLEFGTGGLRGVMGGGTNRMNTLEINKATQGLAEYILENGVTKRVARTQTSLQKLQHAFLLLTELQLIFSSHSALHLNFHLQSASLRLRQA